MLLRSVPANDGTHPVVIAFICRKTHRIVHAGIAAVVEKHLHASMAVFNDDHESFHDLAVHCSAPVPEGDPPGSRRRPVALSRLCRKMNGRSSISNRASPTK